MSLLANVDAPVDTPSPPSLVDVVATGAGGARSGLGGKSLVSISPIQRKNAMRSPIS